MQETCRRCQFHPWVRKILCRKKWQPAPVFLPGKSNGQRSLADYSPQGHKELVTTERPNDNKLATLLLFSHLSRPTLWGPMDCSTQGFSVLHYLPEFAQMQVHWVSDAIQPSRPLLSPPPASIFPSIRGFTNESALCIRWPKYRSFSISPSNEYSGLISFSFDWFDLCWPKGLSRVFSSATVLKHQFSALSLLYDPALVSIQNYWKNHSFDYMDLCQQSDISAF